MKVGDPIWQFDVNRRVYRRDETGRTIGAPIWREHWIEMQVVGETRVSWLVDRKGRGPDDRSAKLSKKAGRWLDYETDPSAIEELAWAYENRRRIVELVERCGVETLRQVAALVEAKGAADV